MLTVDQFADMLGQWHFTVPLVFSLGGTDGKARTATWSGSQPDPEGTARGGEGGDDTGRATADPHRVDAAGADLGD